MSLQTDDEFVRRICGGDKDAFDSIFRKYYSILLNYANKIIKDTAIAEDLIQDVFFNIWNKREKLANVTYLGPYLRMTVHNQCISYYRKQITYETINIENYNLIEFEQLYAEILQYQQNTTINTELSKAIAVAIEGLPPQCRVVFTLSRTFGFKNAEIANFLDISVKAVEKHVTKALSHLRLELIEYLPELAITIFFIHHTI